MDRAEEKVREYELQLNDESKHRERKIVVKMRNVTDGQNDDYYRKQKIEWQDRMNEFYKNHVEMFSKSKVKLVYRHAKPN